MFCYARSRLHGQISLMNSLNVTTPRSPDHEFNRARALYSPKWRTSHHFSAFPTNWDLSFCRRCRSYLSRGWPQINSCATLQAETATI